MVWFLTSNSVKRSTCRNILTDKTTAGRIEQTWTSLGSTANRSQPFSEISLCFSLNFEAMRGEENPFKRLIKKLEKPEGGHLGSYFSLPLLQDPRIGQLFPLFSFKTKNSKKCSCNTYSFHSCHRFSFTNNRRLTLDNTNIADNKQQEYPYYYVILETCRYVKKELIEQK